MVDATYDADFAAQARDANRRYVAGRIGVYAFLGFFALIYLLPLFVDRRQLVPRTAGNHAERPDRPAAQLLA